MQKTLSFLVLCLLLAPLSASAADFHSGKEYLLGKDQASSGDLYAAGNLTIEGVVPGDFLGAGNSVLFTGSVSQDLQVAGGSLVLLGNVGDDLRAAGGSVKLGASVKGDTLVAGGDVTMLLSTLVGGDAVIAGGRVILKGTVQGGLRVYAREVIIDASVKGPVYVAADSVIFGTEAVISGPVTYRSPEKALIREGAVLSGEVVYEEINPRQSPSSPLFWAKLISLWFVLKVLMLFFGALVMSLYYTRAVKGIAQRFFDGFAGNVLLGFAFLVAVPVGAILLMMSVVGLLIGLLILLVYGAMLIINTLYLPALVGGEIYRYFRRESEMTVSVLTIVIGTVALAVLALIPLIGWAIAFILMLGTLGAGVRFKWSELKSYR